MSSKASFDSEYNEYNYKNYKYMYLRLIQQ